MIKASPVKELCFSTSSKSCQAVASFTQVLVMSLFSIWLRFELGIYEADFNGINSAFRRPTLRLFLLLSQLSLTPLPSFLTISANRTAVLMLASLAKQKHPESHIHILPVPSGFSVLGISFHKLLLLHRVCLPFPFTTLVRYIILKPVLL